MTGLPLLDKALLGVSAFVAALTLWLGLTVPMTARRRSWGLWLVAAGLLLGSVFFLCHTAILGLSLTGVVQEAATAWVLGWASLAATPLAWYVAMLWYAGCWDPGGEALRRRHRAWLAVAVAMAAGGMALLASRGMPLLDEMGGLWGGGAADTTFDGMPVSIALYSFYIVMCVVLALDALRRPAPSHVAMGDLARRRARPWLVAASVALLLVALVVAWTMIWAHRAVGGHGLLALEGRSVRTLGWLDLSIETLIAAAILCLGQAIVSYEIFTGGVLPRGGLKRLWRLAIAVAAALGAGVAWTVTGQAPATYVALAATVAIASLVAVMAWRAHSERDRAVADLRSFVGGPRLYEAMMDPSPALPASIEAIRGPFEVLCREVLGTREAWLAPVGPMAALFGPPLAYPAGSAMNDDIATVAAACAGKTDLCIALAGAAGNGARWAVPLWGSRGRIGVLLLGAKAGGGLYTSEEIETARSAGERMIDMQVSTETARRLVALQRGRLAESLVMDRRSRRVLHDDALPGLHAAILGLSAEGSDTPNVTDALRQLAETHKTIAGLLREMPGAANPDVATDGLVPALRRVVDDEFRGAFDDVTWDVSARAEDAARALSPLQAEVMFCAAREAVRNSARHGRGGEDARTLTLRASISCADGLEIAIEDDGVGFSGDGSAGGAGQGLAFHGTMMAVVGGCLDADTREGRTRVVVRFSENPARDDGHHGNTF